MDFTPTPTQLLRLSPVTDRGPRRTTPVFVTMETEQDVLSPAKPTQVRVRDEEQFGYGFDCSVAAKELASLSKKRFFSVILRDCKIGLISLEL